MKKTLFFAGAALSFLFFNASGTFAQSSPGQIVSNTGVGYSTMFGTLIPDAINVGNSINNAFGLSPETISWSAIPAISETVDVGLTHHFSMGIGVGYQSGTETFSNYINSVTYQSETVKEIYSRTNYGVRLTIHFANSGKLDPYLGTRLGMSMWSVSNNANDPNFANSKGSLSLPSFQEYFGIRFYATPLLGFHMEVAVGTPYLAEAGVTLKFGGI